MTKDIIRPARIDDVEDLAALEIAAFETDRVSARSFRRYAANPGSALIVAERAGKVAGYALLAFRKNSSKARLYSIAVDAALGKGFGRMLIDACEQQALQRGAASITLEVNASNVRAIALYERAGFRCFGRHVRYYEDGADALRLEKSLREPKLSSPDRD